MRRFGHGAAGDVGALLGEAGVGQIATGVLAVGHVDVGDDVHDAAVGLLGQALILAAIAGLHIHVGIGQFEILEKHSVQVVVIVLPRVRQQAVEIPAALVNHRRQPYNLRSCSYNNQKLQLPILLKFCHYIVILYITLFILGHPSANIKISFYSIGQIQISTFPFLFLM